ncbi:MAG: dockerin type I repeat-containing protein [Clostridia bacterium]|nr:dockerin type I repeat-containing protein [Clostridia bacterium]
MKKPISLFLSIILLIGAIAVPCAALSVEDLDTGTLVTFGSYPQSRITDPSLLDKLNSLPLEWTFYKYYADGKQENFMEYADTTFSGNRYRAVRFSKYRPRSFNSGLSYDQRDNGYEPGYTYWFIYEPLVWRVLDPSSGLIMCEKLIDSQPFNNVYYHNDTDGENYSDKDYTHFASNWAYSSLRAWLNDDFYNTAFDAEKNCIEKTELSSPSSMDRVYDAGSTTDKVFLLSRSDVMNESYGFSSSSNNGEDTNRTAFGTDYAKCQGLFVSTARGYYYTGASYWRLRTPGYRDGVSTVYVEGYVSSSTTDGTYSRHYGIRPALKVDLESAISGSLLKIREELSSGDIDGNGQILADDARIALRASAQLEKLSAEQIRAADVDGNGQVLADDARQILRFSAKLQQKFEKAV